jgi:F-type H+-transporting ATPase subunit b
MQSPLRTLLLAALGAAALLVATAVPALAEEHEKPALVAVDVVTAVIAVVVFVLLLVVLTKTAWKPILQGLQKREATIKQAVDDAAEASAKAKELVGEYEQKLATASDEARSILDEGRKDADALRKRIEEEARRAVEEMHARARRDIEQAYAKAHEELVKRVAAISTEVAGRIIKRRLDPESHAEIVDEVIRDFAQTHAPAVAGRKA